MQIREFSPGDDARLYELYRTLSREPDSDRRRELVETISVHSEFQSKVRAASRIVLKGFEKNGDLLAELVQQTTFRLVELFLGGHSTYEDVGPTQFNGWIWKIMMSAANRGLAQCRPFWLKHKSIRPVRPFRTASTWFEATVDWEDVKVAISRIQDPLTRDIVDEWGHGFSMAESARLHRLTFAKVRKRRDEGVVEIRRMLLPR